MKHKDGRARFGFYTFLTLTQLQMCKCVCSGLGTPSSQKGDVLYGIHSYTCLPTHVPTCRRSRNVVSRTHTQVAEPKLFIDFSVCQSEMPCLLSLDFGRQTTARV